jgi:hypothetical protein
MNLWRTLQRAAVGFSPRSAGIKHGNLLSLHNGPIPWENAWPSARPER